MEEKKTWFFVPAPARASVRLDDLEDYEAVCQNAGKASGSAISWPIHDWYNTTKTSAGGRQAKRKNVKNEETNEILMTHLHTTKNQKALNSPISLL